MLNQFYVHKSHPWTLIINLLAKNDIGFWPSLHYLLYYFKGTHLASRSRFLKIFKGLVLIAIHEVWLPKCPECVNINLIIMMLK